MNTFTLDEIIFGMNQTPTAHNIRESLCELQRRGYYAVWDNYVGKWILV